MLFHYNDIWGLFAAASWFPVDLFLFIYSNFHLG